MPFPPIGGGPLESLEGLLHSRTTAASARTQRSALVAIGELEALRRGSPEDQALAWYYMHFALGYAFTVKRNGQPVTRKGWRTPRQVGDHLGFGDKAPHVLSVSPAGPITTWAVVDVDESSRYHPGSPDGEGIEPVGAALARIGLREPLEFQSSHSEGIHLWFPLAEAVPTLTLARQMLAACRAADLEVRGGVLELRPNEKAPGADYLTIRAPMTGEGNALWVEGFGLVEDDLAVLRLSWERAQGSNQLTPSEVLSNTRGPFRTKPAHGRESGGGLRGAVDRLAEGFTGPSQTRELSLAALQVAGLLERLADPEAIRQRCADLVSSAPGFALFCSHQQEVLSGRYWDRTSLARAASMEPGYRGTWKERANLKAADYATQRAHAAIEAARATGIRYRSDRAAFEALQGHGAPARSWWRRPANAAALASLRELVGPCQPEAPRSTQEAA